MHSTRVDRHGPARLVGPRNDPLHERVHEHAADTSRRLRRKRKGQRHSVPFRIGYWASRSATCSAPPATSPVSCTCQASARDALKYAADAPENPSNEGADRQLARPVPVVVVRQDEPFSSHHADGGYCRIPTGAGASGNGYPSRVPRVQIAGLPSGRKPADTFSRG